jgi:hypothetical protein
VFAIYAISCVFRSGGNTPIAVRSGQISFVFKSQGERLILQRQIDRRRECK